jgi:hypothetical protein
MNRYIINPSTNRKVKIGSKLAKQIVANYPNIYRKVQKGGVPTPSTKELADLLYNDILFYRNRARIQRENSECYEIILEKLNGLTEIHPLRSGLISLEDASLCLCLEGFIWERLIQSTISSKIVALRELKKIVSRDNLNIITGKYTGWIEFVDDWLYDALIKDKDNEIENNLKWLKKLEEIGGQIPSDLFSSNDIAECLYYSNKDFVYLLYIKNIHIHNSGERRAALNDLVTPELLERVTSKTRGWKKLVREWLEPALGKYKHVPDDDFSDMDISPRDRSGYF